MATRTNFKHTQQLNKTHTEMATRTNFKHTQELNKTHTEMATRTNFKHTQELNKTHTKMATRTNFKHTQQLNKTHTKIATRTNLKVISIFECVHHIPRRNNESNTHQGSYLENTAVTSNSNSCSFVITCCKYNPIVL